MFRVQGSSILASGFRLLRGLCWERCGAGTFSFLGFRASKRIRKVVLVHYEGYAAGLDTLSKSIHSPGSSRQDSYWPFALSINGAGAT